jgi:hypothetical protein
MTDMMGKNGVATFNCGCGGVTCVCVFGRNNCASCCSLALICDKSLKGLSEAISHEFMHDSPTMAAAVVAAMLAKALGTLIGLPSWVWGATLTLCCGPKESTAGPRKRKMIWPFMLPNWWEQLQAMGHAWTRRLAVVPK